MNEENDHDTLDLSRIKMTLWQAIVVWGILFSIGSGVGASLLRLNTMATSVDGLRAEFSLFRSNYEARVNRLELAAARREGSEERKGGLRNE